MSDKLTDRVITFKQACEISKESREKGLYTIFATGIFDILHMGHALFLKSLKKKAAVVIVGVDDNVTARKIKGYERPFFDETERAELLSAMEFVDYTFIFKGPCNARIISDLKPTYYGISPFDPNRLNKKRDAEVADVKLFISPPFLKSYSSSKLGRTFRYEHLTSIPTLQEQVDWETLQR